MGIFFIPTMRKNGGKITTERGDETIVFCSILFPIPIAMITVNKN